jgi:hypothetical protein
VTDTLDELERLLAATQGEEWRVSNRDPVRVVDGTGAYIALCDPHHKGDPLQETRAALIVAAINALPGLLAICNAAKTALGHLDDPTGGDEINDMRRASDVLRIALKGT